MIGHLSHPSTSRIQRQRHRTVLSRKERREAQEGVWRQRAVATSTDDTSFQPDDMDIYMVAWDDGNDEWIDEDRERGAVETHLVEVVCG